MGRTAHIGSAPYVARAASMKVTITSVGGRAPPARKTPRPSAESHWPAGAHGLHVAAPSSGPVRRCSAQADVRCRARPGAPSDAASPRCGRSSPPPIGSPPTASHVAVRDRTPTGRVAPALRVSTSSVFPSTPSSQTMEPLGNPGGFTSDVGVEAARALCLLRDSRARIEPDDVWLPRRAHLATVAQPSVAAEVDTVEAVSPPPRAVSSSADDGRSLRHRKVAKPSTEEPDAADTLRPDLWGLGSATTLVYPTASR